MSQAGELQAGARVAILGGGIAGAAAAAAIAGVARSLRVPIDVTLFDGSRASSEGSPVVLTAECRARLAALGCRVPLEWRARLLEGVEVIAGGKVARLATPPGGLWVVGRGPD